MQSPAQEVTMLFNLIAGAKDSWACFTQREVEQRVDYRQSQPRYHQFLKVGMRMIKEAFLPHIRHASKQKKNKFYSSKITIQPYSSSQNHILWLWN